MLVEFASAVDAVTCAVAVQERMADQIPSGPQIQFRVGINVGDIIIDGDDIFGNGVNVAARVEGECAPGPSWLCRSSQISNASHGSQVKFIILKAFCCGRMLRDRTTFAYQMAQGGKP
jgi:class 3 adenylate cyclase